ncbi:response regulator [Geomonas sp. Red32]|uniref:response regulator n=1 Tax=Geomonas sp. Red32 TaxID=2912856 RepID=UPI00202CC672|nr:response regulator [Geomonas sp. Red32]MCM0080882.1 response regulator [Geomonas sp. Red32]
MKTILVVDDDAEIRGHLLDLLQGEGYGCESAGSVKEALAFCRQRDFDVILLDHLMPGGTGIDALAELRRALPKAKIIMITAFATVENAIEAIRKGAADYLSKPFKVPELLTTIRKVLEEAKFEDGIRCLAIDQTLSALASPIRRNILKLLHQGEQVRLMEITRALGIDDHTKVVFHLRILKEAGVIEQHEDKSYLLTREGLRVMDCLKTLEQILSE